MSEHMLTIDEISACPKQFLDATDICGLLGTDPQHIREQAQANPEKLGFPVVVMRNRVKIPRDAFVYFCRYGRPVAHRE